MTALGINTTFNNQHEATTLPTTQCNANYALPDEHFVASTHRHRRYASDSKNSSNTTVDRFDEIHVDYKHCTWSLVRGKLAHYMSHSHEITKSIFLFFAIRQNASFLRPRCIVIGLALLTISKTRRTMKSKTAIVCAAFTCAIHGNARELHGHARELHGTRYR